MKEDLEKEIERKEQMIKDFLKYAEVFNRDNQDTLKTLDYMLEDLEKTDEQKRLNNPLPCQSKAGEEKE